MRVATQPLNFKQALSLNNCFTENVCLQTLLGLEEIHLKNDNKKESFFTSLTDTLNFIEPQVQV